MSRRRVVAILAALATVAGCGGPREPIEMTVKEFPGDVLLGKGPPSATPTPSVVPSANLEPAGFPSFIQPPPPATSAPEAALPTTTTTKKGKTKPVDPCPKADALSVPVHEATRTLSMPPKKQSVAFRNEGSYDIGGPSGARDKGSYPASSVRKVVPEKTQADGSFSFTVVEDVRDESSSTTYLVDPAAALYLLGVTTTRADGSKDQFLVADPRSMPLLPLPVTPGEDFTAQGFSPANQTSMAYTGRVGDKVRVDACGKLLDAWEVRVSGQVLAPNKQLSFTATYAIGTQYGGVSLRDAVEVGCPGGASVSCDDGRTVQSKNIATVALEPTLAGGAA